MNSRSAIDEPNLANLNDLVRGIVSRSALKDQVLDVSLEFAPDDAGSGFVRVLLNVKDAEKMPQADLLILLEQIEDGVFEQDHWYASVRFSEAA